MLGTYEKYNYNKVKSEVEQLLSKIGKEEFVDNYYDYTGEFGIKELKDKLKAYYGSLIFTKKMNIFALVNIIEDVNVDEDIKKKAIKIIELYNKDKLKDKPLDRLRMNNNLESVNQYSNLIRELRKREIIYSNNIKQDISRFYILKKYTSGFLIDFKRFYLADKSDLNADAYIYNGIHEPVNNIIFRNVDEDVTKEIKNVTTYENILFKYLIITKITDNFELDYLLELTWDDFFKEKKLKGENSYYIRVDESIIGKYFKWKVETNEYRLWIYLE